MGPSINATDGTDHPTELTDDELRTEQKSSEVVILGRLDTDAQSIQSQMDDLYLKRANLAGLSAADYLNWVSLTSRMLRRALSDEASFDVSSDKKARYAEVSGMLLVRMRETG